ncbi:medium-chain acyl-[acyl-carrier-protein] hydrolase [Streptomyces sp. BK208]|uniref:thioesterase II family protein n=1 Tax=Streptomyces sp. BK208 TaxID=2512150 RepID=UPI0010615EB9|nr:alpha/beta fold hydrolase [Streptomyces sp. BK208]TDT28132.1 medium-chain acyl-[acyl-carrier-protein] hydrolase [Streptomyces sp. BK208]
MSPADLLSQRSAWFPRPVAAPDAGQSDPATAPLRLVCFPYAGGTVSAFRGWQQRLGDDVAVVPVQPPGRGLRLRETPYDRMAPLAEAVADALTEHRLAHDYALFGHSMGALLAYEVACVLRRRGLEPPRHLFVSGSRAPHLYGDRADHTLSDAALREVIRGLGGFGDADALGAAYFDRRLPVLRADLRACERYRWEPRPTLDCPTTAFSATADPIATPEMVEAWRPYTSGSFLRRHLTGDHFFLNGGPSRDRLLAHLGTELDALGTTPHRKATREAPWTF